MRKWDCILSQVNNVISKHYSKQLFFRGHSNSSWKLLPTLARKGTFNENWIFYEFKQRGSHLFKKPYDSWDILFLMQHHGLPTRLLDWSGCFSIALYFALKDWQPGNEAAVWILDPYALNKTWYHKMDREVMINVKDDFQHEYYDYYINLKTEETKKLPCDIAAIFGSADYPRMQSQKSYFTLHDDLYVPLEEKYPEFLTKIVIPNDLLVFEDAKKYLFLGGVNEFALFPDIDGLARQLIQERFSEFGLYFKFSNELEISIRDFNPDKNIAKKIMAELLDIGIEKSFFQKGQFNEDYDKNEVLLIGRKVPIYLAKKIIKITLKHAPFIKYLRFYEENDNHVLIGGKTDIAINNGAVEITKDDLNEITQSKITKSEFEKRLTYFSYNNRKESIN